MFHCPKSTPKEPEAAAARRSSPEPDDVPPALPSAPPPEPMWTTFPGHGQSHRLSADSLFEPGELLPDQGARVWQDEPSQSCIEEEPVKDVPMRGGPAPTKGAEQLGREDSTTRIRTDILRRKSEFLGLNVEETEEYKKIKAGMCPLVSQM